MDVGIPARGLARGLVVLGQGVQVVGLVALHPIDVELDDVVEESQCALQLFLELTGDEGVVRSLRVQALDAEARDLFLEVEGIDLSPAAAIVVSSLQQAAAKGEVIKGEVIMLNVTGGGYAKIEEAGKMKQVKPNLVISPEKSDPDSVKQALAALYK